MYKDWGSEIFQPKAPDFQVVETVKIYPLQQSSNEIRQLKTRPESSIMPCSHLMCSQEITVFTVEGKKNLLRKF